METFNKYQKFTRTTAVFPDGIGLPYLTLGLTGEAGEVAEKIKKSLRDPSKALDERAVAFELGDVLWYLASLADLLGYPLEEIARMNVAKLESRKERKVLKGDGDNR